MKIELEVPDLMKQYLDTGYTGLALDLHRMGTIASFQAINVRVVPEKPDRKVVPYASGRDASFETFEEALKNLNVRRVLIKGYHLVLRKVGPLEPYQPMNGQWVIQCLPKEEVA